MSSRIVLHLDMDAFFAAIEVLSNPSLRGRPLVVGGMPTDRGVVSTASYEARRFGVRSGIPLAEAARLCPRAIFLPCRPGPYVYFSTRILKLLLRRTPRVELFSIDEAFVDGEGICKDRASATRWAREVQDEIFGRYGLTGSFGIGPNKLVAKMATRLQKPRGITFLSPADFREVFWTKPLDSLYGVGEKTARSLSGLGMATIGDLARTDSRTLTPYFGRAGPWLVDAANGREDSPVIPYGESPPAKSIGHEHTFDRDVRNRAEASRLLLALADQVGFALRQERKRASAIHLRIRWSDFTATIRQTTLREPTDRTADLYRCAQGLFRRFDVGGELRMLGLSVSSLTPAESGRADSLWTRDNRWRELDDATDRVRERFGYPSLVRAGSLGDRRKEA